MTKSRNVVKNTNSFRTKTRAESYDRGVFQTSNILDRSIGSRNSVLFVYQVCIHTFDDVKMLKTR